MISEELDDRVAVRDLLDVERFGLRVLTAAEELDRSVRWAQPTDLLDPRPYLRGGELVLTVGSALGTPDACRVLVANLVAAGVSALGFGVGDVLDQVPDALIEACRSARLPLLEVPHGVPFSSLTELIADRRWAIRESRGQRIQRLIGTLLAAITDGQGLPGLLGLASAELGGVFAVRLPGTPAQDGTGPATRTTALPGVDGGRLSWWPCREGDVPPDAAMLDQLAQVLSVRCREENLEAARRRRHVGNLVRAMQAELAAPDVLREALEQKGIPAGTVVAAAWPVSAAPLVAAGLPGAALAETDEVLLTFTDGGAPAETLAQQAALPCGLGAQVGLAGLRLSVTQAIRALALSTRRGTPAAAADLVSLEGLLHLQPEELLTPFASTVVAPLVEHDDRHGTALLATVRAFLAGDGAVNSTARALYLHPNSLRHRLARVHELTGANPFDFSGRVTLTIGLWTWDTLRPPGPGQSRRPTAEPRTPGPD